MIEEIAELIDIYLKRIAKDHHKTKDGYFSIECVFRGYHHDKTKPEFIAVHDGYLNDLVAHYRDTFEEAAEDLRDFLVECIAEYKDEDWGWDDYESEASGTMDEGVTPVS